MRWIRWLGGLFGVTWLLITGVLWTGRPPDGRLQDVLLRTSARNAYSYALATIGDIRPRQLTPLDDDYYFVGASDNWEWLYFGYSDWSRPSNDAELRRFSPQTNTWYSLEKVLINFERPHAVPVPVYKIPNQERFIYPSGRDVMVTNGDGTEIINLTNGRLGNGMSYAMYTCFSLDNQWFYYLTIPDYHLVRMRVDGTMVEDLTYLQITNSLLDFTEQEPQQLFNMCRTARGEYATGWMYSDGLWAGISPVQIFLPTHQLVIFYIEAIDIRKDELVWQIDSGSAFDIFASSDENTLYYFDDNGSKVRRIQWDGTGLTTLHTLNSFQTPLYFDPDNEILLYLESNNGTAPIELWRRTRDGVSQKLASFSNSIHLQRYPEPDKDWVVFRVESQPYTATYRIHPDGTGLERILNGPSWWNYVEAFGPKWELQWHPPIHAIFGAALLVISLLRFPKAWNRA
ncbi:MAG: hypothetical protein K8L91_26575 [Anaerolineae bacterium]|nr:hypothetical protein [Anaerolineae bacterium]